MENNNSIILKISNIKWDENPKNNEKLPKEIDLQWVGKQWNYNQVSNWLSNHFNNTLSDLTITESETPDTGG
jgi:hypothetical protein|tara:strand:+ start:21 stop:236 length:216 start_codon:yes stop_codon:yes gene_type:complete